MDDRWVATKAYTDWLADGSPWQDARPIHDLGDRLAAHGYTVYYHGNQAHLTADPPEDHTPFSATGWPVPAPYPVCNALDVMPPAAGQTSKLTGRPLPGLPALAARLRAEKMNSAPGAAWIKYMNWEPGDGNCWHDSWQPDYARRASTDRGHLHVSGRSDMTGYTMAAGYDLVARTEGGGVPLWGWDASHYDDIPNPAKLYGEGFRFMTHKAGGDKDDAELAAWWATMKPYRGRMLLGAYWIQYPGTASARADAFIARLDSQCPGWRDGPFILQVDCEIWNGNTATKPGKADIKAFCDRLRVKAPALMPIVYAPKWAYGDSLAGLGYPLWASSYVTGTGAASTLYPGDSSTRWAAYSGITPTILQFTSSATIAGQTTCDANAFRGTLEQLTALLAPGWKAKEMDINDRIGDEAYPNRTVGDVFRDFSKLRGYLVGDPRDTLNANIPPTAPVALIAAVAGQLGDSLAGLKDAIVSEIVAEIRGAELAEAARDADNLARVLAALAAGPFSAGPAAEAIRQVYGDDVFNRAQALASEGSGDPDTDTEDARRHRQADLQGE